MRVRLNWIELVGANRLVEFEPGLNIITGPIASGKTTLIRLVRFLLGSSLRNLPMEPRKTVAAVSGSVLLQDESYTIARPAVTTATAKVDVAGDSATWRLPAISSNGGQSYTQWLLDRLDLPRLQVPSAPTRPESEPTPISINDYFLYGYLSQKELGFEVFGHKDSFKNIKRKYVFEVIYGFYDIRTAQLQERLRSVAGQLRHLHAQAELFSSFFEDTALANRAALEHELAAVRRNLAKVEADSVALAKEVDQESQTHELQKEVLKLESDLAGLNEGVTAERAALRNMQELIGQLESQSAKLTRAIVSGKHLMDIEFIVCPRCGSAVDSGRAPEGEVCYLCLQAPTLDFSRDVLVREQDAVEAQLAESQDLLGEREIRLRTLQKGRLELEDQLRKTRVELDFQTRSYVSARADDISAAASKRTALRSRERELEEYLSVLRRVDESQRRAAELTVERDNLQMLLEVADQERLDAVSNVEKLVYNLNEILETFRPPSFGEELGSSIDRNTYLPIYHGRRFDDLSSPGLATLVNVAHALAHQVTAIELDLRLPGLLIIDGLSEHLGQEGLDPERLGAVYDYLIKISEQYGEDLQVILVDNELPAEARKYVRLELSETDRLIPAEALAALE